MNKQITSRVVRPILSTTHKEARRGTVYIFKSNSETFSLFCLNCTNYAELKQALKLHDPNFYGHDST